MEIFQDVSINPRVLIPPAWKLNNNAIEILGKVRFALTETEERLFIFLNKSLKKIKVPKVFNWDSTGYPEKNIINIIRGERRFKVLIKQTPPIVRVALHPRDPHKALKEQRDLIKLIVTDIKSKKIP